MEGTTFVGWGTLESEVERSWIDVNIITTLSPCHVEQKWWTSTIFFYVSMFYFKSKFVYSSETSSDLMWGKSKSSSYEFGKGWQHSVIKYILGFVTGLLHIQANIKNLDTTTNLWENFSVCQATSGWPERTSWTFPLYFQNWGHGKFALTFPGLLQQELFSNVGVVN